MDIWDLIYRNFNRYIKNFIDGPRHFLVVFTLFIIFLLNQFEILHYPGKNIMMPLVLASFFISRKSMLSAIYLFEFIKFYKIVNQNVNTKQQFKQAYSYYFWFCNSKNLEKMKTGIELTYSLLNFYFNLKLNSIEVNVTNGEEEDFCHREDLIFISFVTVVCDFISSYDVKKHYILLKKLEDSLNEIHFEDFLRKMIIDCYNDGKGFMSTLNLSLLIIIYLRIPAEKRKYIKIFYKNNNYKNIGWLNRKLFESIIIIVMMDEDPSSELHIIEEKLAGSSLDSDDSKYEFRNNILPRRLYQYGIEYAN